MVFVLESEDDSGMVQARDLMGEIASSQLSLFGDSGAAANRLRLISFDGQIGLIRFSTSTWRKPGRRWQPSHPSGA